MFPIARRLRQGVSVTLLAGAAGAGPLRAQVAPEGAAPPPARPAALRVPPSIPSGPVRFPSIAEAEDARSFAEAARGAWSYVERQYQPGTGLVNSVASYPYATMWDVASGLAALHCANRLGLLPDPEYDARMRRALQTLRTAPLFEGSIFNKNYSTRTGALAGRDGSDAAGARRGYGWSALDLGRFLVWLRIIATHDPEYAGEIEAIVGRIDFSRVVGSGYLWGETISRSGRRTRYTEGRIPYEQYSAAGYALWGHPAELAARLEQNSLPIRVLDVPLFADRRGLDHLTSEPFILAGLELGWSPEMASFAANVLRAQAARYRRTGQVTMASEDAIPRAPHYFYYYTLNYHGTQFAVTTQTGAVLRSPRWVSAKAAFAWNALLPSAYTRLAMAAVAPARSATGWSSGVFEGGAQPTGSENVNTAAVILEAALYHATGRPLLGEGNR